MSKYVFAHLSEIPGQPDIYVEFDDTTNPFIEDVMLAFHQFLLGVTYQPSSIEKYLDVDALDEAQLKRAT